MPKLDVYHNLVKRALVKDNWTITHAPLYLKVGYRRLYIDLGAEQLLAAEKGMRKIAIEVKSFRCLWKNSPKASTATSLIFSDKRKGFWRDI